MRAASDDRARPARWSYNWVAVVVLVGLAATAGLTIVTAKLASANERHLLDLRTKEVGAALTSALPDTQTPLGAAAALANLTAGDPSKLRRFAADYVGAGKQFTSMSLWRIARLEAGPIEVLGSAPELPRAPGGATTVLRAAAERGGLTVRGLLQAPAPRIAYAFAGSKDGRFIVEAEQALAASRYMRLPANTAYSDLNVAVYMGKRAVRSRLLLRTVPQLPLPGEHGTTVVPFGNESLDVVVSARQPLGGSLPQRMPWAIAILGVLLTGAAGALTSRLIATRRQAQDLAGRNRGLYAEQRTIAQNLQHALLPEALPEIEGVRLAARYEAGVPGIDIGGDWYDLIRLGPGRLLLVVGDVSGRGIQAATAMASLRFAIQYAAQSDPPELFLPKLSALRPLRRGGRLATVLCLVVDLDTRRVSVTSAGHLPPLLVHDGHGEFLPVEVGLPVGVDGDCTYASSSYPIPAGATLLGFTDGLVERRDESLDQGLDRLCRVAAGADGELDELIARVLELVRGTQSVDDTAIAAIQWLTQTNQRHG